jgi:hypothetical protein
VDLIRALRAVLDPLVEHTTFAPFAPLEMEPLNVEYGGALSDGRIALFGFYQFPAERTITALLWTVLDPPSGSPEAAGQVVIRHHRTWGYDPSTHIDGLVRAIVAEVTGWLQPAGPTGGPGPETFCASMPGTPRRRRFLVAAKATARGPDGRLDRSSWPCAEARDDLRL